MGKKRTRPTYTSKGMHSNVSKTTLKAVSRDTREMDQMINKLAAWRAGQNPWITVAGTTTREAFIRVRANILYGDPRRRSNMFSNKGEE